MLKSALVHQSYIGRKRRKKCDETHPHCSACIRNSLDCKWPSEDNQLPDGRSRHSRGTKAIMRAVASSGVSLMQLPPFIMMPAPFSSSECTYLYRYFASTILPRFVQRNSVDKTHMLRLAPQFSPLFGAMVAVAGMQLPTKDRWPAHLALQSYLHAIHSIQMSLTDITKAGCDDRILATVSLLACFEACIRFLKFSCTQANLYHCSPADQMPYPLSRRMSKPRASYLPNADHANIARRLRPRLIASASSHSYTKHAS